MTDETRSEATPPAPDGDKFGPTGKDDSLDSWFRPVREAEQGQDEQDEGGTSERESESEPGSGSAPLSDSPAEPESGDADVAPSLDAAPTQVVRLDKLADRAEEADQGGPVGPADAADEGSREDKSRRADRADRSEPEKAASMPAAPANDRTQVIPAAPAKSASGSGIADNGGADNDRTQVFQVPLSAPSDPAAAAPTQAIPRADVADVADAGKGAAGNAAAGERTAESGMAARPGTPRTPESDSGAESKVAERKGESASWSPAPGPGPQYREPQPKPQAQQRQERQGAWQPQQYESAQYKSAQRQSAQQQPPQYQGQRQSTQPYQSSQTQPYEAPGGVASILPPRAHGGGYDDFDSYSFTGGGEQPGRGRGRRALLTVASVFVIIVAVAAALVFSGKVKVFGTGAKPVPTVGFSPSGSDAGSNATQTGAAFLTAWENGDLKAAANITDDQPGALAALTAYKNDLKVSGLTLMPGTASAQGWMTFNVTAQIGTPSSAWSYSSGMATYSSTIDGYTRWFVKWQPNVLFTSLKSGQKLALGAIPPVANKVVDKNGTDLTSANAPSLAGIVSALEKSAPPAAGTAGQQVQIDNADGTFASKVVKLTDPVTTGAVKTTIDLNVQKAAQSAVNQAPNSSMVVLQPSTGNILAVANNPPGGLDTAMLGKYAPGSTFKTITSTLVLNKGVISNLNQTWDCPPTLTTDGITLHNSEQESGVGKSFLWDFADSCNNAFSRFGAENKVSRTDVVNTAHDYFGFNQMWDVGLSAPTTYGYVPNTANNSLAEELVGQDRIQTSPLAMASVASTIANGSFKQPILVPGTQQITATAIPGSTDQNLKTLMHQVVIDGTLAGVLPVNGMYAKTGTAEVGSKQPNSWTIAFRGDYAVAALAVGGGFGAKTAGPEVRSLMAAVR